MNYNNASLRRISAITNVPIDRLEPNAPYNMEDLVRPEHLIQFPPIKCARERRRLDHKQVKKYTGVSIREQRRYEALHAVPSYEHMKIFSRFYMLPKEDLFPLCTLLEAASNVQQKHNANLI